MNRAELQRLAEDRILDAERLLAAGRWSGSYYLAGYAVECGLKACIMARVKADGAIFQDKKFSERCWTHDFEELLRLANLEAVFTADAAMNSILSTNWATATQWDESSRYEQKTQSEAQSMYDAIASDPDGVLIWIRTHW